MNNLDVSENQNSVAIIGMAGRFPGAKNIDEFWCNLCNGVMSITSFSDEELLLAGVDLQTLHDPHYVKAGAVLEDIESFDAGFFEMSPREVEITDPQQRLFMEVAWEALESAGYAPKTFEGSIGVYAGAIISNYLLRNVYSHFSSASSVEALQMLIGNDKDYLATHLSYKLNLTGPSISVQTACSTSLVAVHLACQGLLNHECDMALAGGVSVRVPQKAGYLHQEGGIFSSDGCVRTFDARASGTIFGNGLGLVVLKRLGDALDDGDNIYAVIKGSAINNDGSLKVGYMAPSVDGQASVIAEALAVAEIDPETITYIEAHGTGTPLGDPIEVAALTEVFRASTAKKQFCALGSVKTNIGHLEAAAGIASLIKTALALKHRQLPPSLNFEQPNPEIDFAASPFHVNTALTEWQTEGHPRRAGVSSFGMGGTNVHMVLEEAPIASAGQSANAGGTSADDAKQFYLLPLSARNESGLRSLARAYHTWLTQPGATLPSLADLCYSAGRRRAHHEFRLALVGDSIAVLADQLGSYLEGCSNPNTFCGQVSGDEPVRLAFVFPGQGAQYKGMGRELFTRESAFRAALLECDAAMWPYTGWSLIEQLHAEEEQTRFDDVDVGQPLLFAIQVALAAQLREWGIEPDAVIGHSMGEIAAAYVGGALSLQDAARVICQRGQLLRQVQGQGGMIVAALSKEEAEAMATEYEERLEVAAYNGPQTTVFSGETAGLKELLERLQKAEIFCRWVQVDYASHCWMMEHMKEQVVEELQGVKGRRGRAPLYSTVSKEISWGEELDGRYWAENLRRPVQFWPMLERLAEEGYRVFVEISPRPMLSWNVRDAIAGGLAIGTLRRQEGEWAEMLRALAALYSAGYEVPWDRVYRKGHYVALPTYPWQRERFWIEPAVEAPHSALTPRASAVHPLLGSHVSVAGVPATQIWEGELSSEHPAYLAEHRLQGIPVLPASAYLELVLAAAREAGLSVRRLWAGRFARILPLPGQEIRRVQVVLCATGSAQQRWEIHSRGVHEEEWSLHASGILDRDVQGFPTTPSPSDAGWLAAWQVRCCDEVPVAEQYAALRACGLDYGPSFQGMKRLWRGHGEALGRLEAPANILADLKTYVFHPAVLDAVLQLVSVLIEPGEVNTSPYVPVGLEAFQLYQQPGAELWGSVRRRSGSEAGTIVADLEVRDGQGACVLTITGLQVQQLESTSRPQLAAWWYQLAWQRRDLSPANSQPAGRWLLFTDEQGVGTRLGQWLAAAGAHVSYVRAGSCYQQLSPTEFEVNPRHPQDFTRLIASAGSEGWRGVIHLWSLGAPSAQQTLSDLEAAHLRGWGSLLHVIQAVVSGKERPRLWVVTAGAQQVPGLPGQIAVEQAGILGLGRTIMQEYPELGCTLVDIEMGGTSGNAELWAEICDGEPGEEVAWRGQERYIARLVHERKEQIEEAGERVFGMEVEEVGVLDSTRLRARPCLEPGVGEVAIEVMATGLNFLDALQAMGTYPGMVPGDPVRPGGECAGRVRAVGAGVERIHVGDAVIAVASGALGSEVITPATFVVSKPADLSFVQAATMPLACMTAWYALKDLARLQAGERVLIHSAATGTGLAALLLARQLGAEVYATAGSETKRAFLRQLGVEQVYDSRSLAFGPAVREATGGQGVDVVLNSLSGEAMRLSLGLLAPYGRFVEIGKRDTYGDTAVGLYGLRRNGSYYVVDLAGMARERPERFGRLLQEVLAGYERGEVQALPVHEYAIEQAGEALRELAQGHHQGKIGVVVGDRRRVQIARQRRTMEELVRAEGSYVITGGFGGLGLTVAQWLVRKGARGIALVGRHEPGEQTRAVCAELRRQGASVLEIVADVSQAQEVAQFLENIEGELGPVRGVVHAAGELADGILAQQQWEKFEQVWGGKGAGAWNLYSALHERNIDWVVFFGSLVGLVGAPGQGNYAAVNSFLGGLAQLWGRCAVCIAWGPWEQVGMAAKQENMDIRLQKEGIESLKIEEGIQAMEAVLLSGESQVGVLRLEMKQGRRWGRKVWETDSGNEGAGNSLRATLLEAPGAERQAMLEQHVREQVGQVLRLPPHRMDGHTPLHTLGLESLMALELRNRLEASLGLQLPATLVWGYPTIAALTKHLAEELGMPCDEPERTEYSASQAEHAVPQMPKERETLKRALAVVEEFSEEEALQSLLGGN